jgi:hypothetical protein
MKLYLTISLRDEAGREQPVLVTCAPDAVRAALRGVERALGLSSRRTGSGSRVLHLERSEAAESGLGGDP